MREESGHEAENNEHPQRAEEIGHPAREVVFGLAREQGKGDEDAERENECFDHNPRFVEGCDDADRVGFQNGEPAQEQEVGGIAFPLPKGQEHEADGAEEGCPHQPAVGLNPVTVGD